MTRAGLARRQPPAAAGALALAFVVTLGALFPTWATFPATWLDSRSHGFAIAAYCAWRLWRARHEFETSSELITIGVALCAIASSFWLLALVTGVRLFHQTFAVVVSFAFASAVFGRRGFDRVWPVAVIFSLALPAWEVLLGPLQTMTVGVNHALVRLSGIPATLSGTQIRFPFGALEVAQSCAGLSYFMSALTISVIYADQFLRRSRARAVAVLLAITLAIVSNWIRVFGLVVIGYRTRMQSSLMTEHALYGWVIFAVVISLFFLATGRIERWEQEEVTQDNLEPDGASTPVAFARPSLLTHHIALVTGAAVFGPLTYFAISSRPFGDALPEPIPGVARSAAWRPRTSRADLSSMQWWTPHMHGEHEQRRYAFASTDTTAVPDVQAIRYAYLGTAQGQELIGSGNAIALPEDLLSEGIVGPLDLRLRTVRQAVVRDGRKARLVWYWYRVAGVETSSTTRAKLLELVSFVRRTTPSELIAVSAPCSGTDCQTAVHALHLMVTGRALAADVPSSTAASNP